jgi:Tat protein secretion system quality control protein TatD with DNase activity
LFDEQAAMVSCHIPDSLLLVETDSPVPYDGKPAEPAWAVRVVERLAEVRGKDPSDLAEILNENFDRYLGL